MSGKPSESFGQLVIRSRLIDIGIPSLFGDAKSNTHKNASLRWSDRVAGGSRSESAETDRFKSRQCDQGAGSAEEVTAIEAGFHDVELW